MPTGMYIDHGNGYILDMTQRFGTFVGFIDTNGGTNGSLVVPSLVGKKFFFVMHYNGTAAFTFTTGGANVTFNVNTGTIVWSFLDVENMRISEPYRYYRIYYGAY